MHRGSFKLMKWMAVIALITAASTVTGLNSARAADNSATGDIAGDDTDLADSNVFTLNTSTLALVKTAFLANGTELVSGQSVPRGTIVRFLIYIDNPTAVPVTDINVADVLDPTFAYQAGSIRVDNSLASSANPTNLDLYNALRVTAPLTDAVDGDVASLAGATVQIGSGSGNGQASIAPDTVWALLIDVEMQ